LKDVKTRGVDGNLTRPAWNKDKVLGGGAHLEKGTETKLRGAKKRKLHMDNSNKKHRKRWRNEFGNKLKKRQSAGGSHPKQNEVYEKSKRGLRRGSCCYWGCGREGG